MFNLSETELYVILGCVGGAVFIIMWLTSHSYGKSILDKLMYVAISIVLAIIAIVVLLSGRNRNIQKKIDETEERAYQLQKRAEELRKRHNEITKRLQELQHETKQIDSNLKEKLDKLNKQREENDAKIIDFQNALKYLKKEAGDDNEKGDSGSNPD